MTRDELDRLLAGNKGLDVPVDTPDGERIILCFDRHALQSPAAFRAVLRRGFGHTAGYCAPHHTQADHDRLVRAMFSLADLASPDGSD